MIISKNKAFLLIEVLITVVIVAVSIIFINHAFTSSLKAVSLSNSYREAILFLKNRTFGLELDPGSERGGLSFFREEEPVDTGFLLKSRALPLTRDDMDDEYGREDLEIERFTASITWQARGAERKIDILTYVPVVIENEEE
jgi:hypothetical protein